LKNTEGPPKNTKNARAKIRNIVLIALVVLAAKFFFDKSTDNDDIGWVVLVLFWTLKSVFDGFAERKKGNKKAAIVNAVIAAAGLCLFVWQVISYIPI
jgi:hypothetical protein